MSKDTDTGKSAKVKQTKVDNLPGVSINVVDPKTTSIITVTYVIPQLKGNKESTKTSLESAI